MPYSTKKTKKNLRMKIKMNTNDFIELKEIIHKMDKSLTSQLSSLDMKMSIFQEQLKNLNEKIEKLERNVTSKAEIKEVEELKMKFSNLEREFYKIKEEASKNTDNRNNVSKFVWIFLTSIVGLLFYIIKQGI